MRILHVAPCYAPAWAYGGPVRVVTGLTYELTRRGHDVTVFTTDGFIGERGLDSPELHGLRVRRFPVVSQRLARSARLFVAPKFGSAIASAVRDADIVHIHEHRTLQAVSAAAACRHADVPYVLSAHGSLPIVVQRVLVKRFFDQLLGKRVIEGARAFVAVSAVERQQLLGYGIDHRRIREIPNGLDSGFFKALPGAGQFRALHGLEGADLVLFVGRIHAQKGLATLLEAFALLARDRERAVLVIAGPDDGYADVLTLNARRWGLESRVHVIGPLYDQDKLRAYVDANVLVYPSAYEIFGLVPLEAIACGTPTVVCDGTACAQIVGELEAGVSVRPHDPEALAAGITEILDRPDPSRQLRHERSLLADRYSWATIAAQVESLYAHCMSQHRAAHGRCSQLARPMRPV